MPGRNQIYETATGMFNKLRLKQFEKQKTFSIDETFLISFDVAFRLWLLKILEEKAKTKRKPQIREHDLWLHADTFSSILKSLKETRR